METLDLSIIIPTYNGRHKVLNCLRALQPQMRHGMEVIVVVDGSTDGSVRMLQQQFGRCAWLRVLQTENQGRARARNNGARNARGSILLFLDDDIEPGHLFIVRHLAAHAGREKAWVTGPVHQKIVDVPHADFLRFRSRHDIAGAHKGGNSGELVRVAMFSTQQISVRARDFQAVGGFLSQLSDTEDFELSVRATDAGHAILFDAGNPVHHCDFANVAQFIRRQNEYRASKDRLARANPRLAARYPEVFEARPDGRHVKGLVRPLFVYNRFWDKLFSSKARLVLPLGLRMRMFDYVISSTEWAAARSAQGTGALEASR